MPTSTLTTNKVIIVGAGLAGLSCALHLKKKGVSFIILELSDTPGGRVRTDNYNGFLLDHGFQVFLPSYAEAKKILDYPKLHLKTFSAGALIRLQGKFFRVSDPLTHPDKMIETLHAPIGTIKDKFKIAQLKYILSQKSTTQILSEPECSSIDALRKYGFSQNIIKRFFRPFFSGIFLENELNTSSRLFNYFFKMFSSGASALPEHGMQEIPMQIARKVGTENIRFNTKVVKVLENQVILDSGEKLESSNIVIATKKSAMEKILYGLSNHDHSRTVNCLYYSADRSPITEPIIILNGDNHGPITNVSVLSNISPAYAPKGKSLISVSVLGYPHAFDDVLEDSVQNQLISWFGEKAKDWTHLRTYSINNALPILNPPTDFSLVSQKSKEGIYLCGDYCSTGSINGALESGKSAAENIIRSLKNVTAGA